jgi:WbqC-like protein family
VQNGAGVPAVKLAIMQPYFFPYVGYFQLIGAVDLFVVYDNIKYTKKGWINRNRLLQSGKDVMFSLPLKSGSDSLDVRDREIAPGFDRDSLLRQFAGAYRKAPHFAQTYELIERCVRYETANLFEFLHHSLVQTCRHLSIGTRVVASSDIAMDHELKSQDRVLATCLAVGATSYVNSIGGWDLYAGEAFRARGVELRFLQSKPFEYPQFDNTFVPWLSIVDVMMFNSREAVAHCLSHGFDLIEKPSIDMARA